MWFSGGLPNRHANHHKQKPQKRRQKKKVEHMSLCDSTLDWSDRVLMLNARSPWWLRDDIMTGEQEARQRREKAHQSVLIKMHMVEFYKSTLERHESSLLHVGWINKPCCSFDVWLDVLSLWEKWKKWQINPDRDGFREDKSLWMSCKEMFKK